MGMEGQISASQVLTETLTGNRTITASELRQYRVFAFDPGGSARTVTIPDATSFWNGHDFEIENTANGAEIITIEDTSTNTICTPTQNETAEVRCRAETWKGKVSASN